METVEKLYYTIGEVAKELNEPDFTIRFWDNHFKVSHKRTKANDRRFTREELDKMKTIKHLLRVRKFTIEGAKMEINYES